MLAAMGSTMTAAILSWCASKSFSVAGEIVVGGVERELRESLRDAGTLGDAERGETGAGLGEKAVGVAVVAAFKFDEQIASGETASEAERAHGGFGAAGDEADFLQERNGAANLLRELDFEFGGDAVAGALLRLIGDGGGDGGIGVAEQHGAPGADEIEQLIAVGVVEILALAAFDDERFAADGAEGADGRVDAADENFFGFGEDFAGAAIVAAVVG